MYDALLHANWRACVNPFLGLSEQPRLQTSADAAAAAALVSLRSVGLPMPLLRWPPTVDRAPCRGGAAKGKYGVLLRCEQQTHPTEALTL
mmetsp:Transcript_3337/g.6368  ORF Transcript_3337/g.6368 Transcript_3337/m.6368 type:complete len:90 (+) Transcript_3337:1029-1298(+)